MTPDIKSKFDLLKKQMEIMELKSYALLNELPWVVRNVGETWIKDIVKKLEAENVLVKDKLDELEYTIKELNK